MCDKDHKVNIHQDLDWRKPNLKYFKTFGSEYYILRDGENLGKFDAKSNMGIW